jgi:hypothetical protein
VKHLQAAGFSVETRMVQNLDAMPERQQVPQSLRSCHTAVVGGYLVEGHVPAGVVRQLLRERPKIAGIAVPGMPAGSPGMESPNPVAYDVLAFDSSGRTHVFAHVAADGTIRR